METVPDGWQDEEKPDRQNDNDGVVGKPGVLAEEVDRGGQVSVQTSQSLSETLLEMSGRDAQK